MRVNVYDKNTSMKKLIGHTERDNSQLIKIYSIFRIFVQNGSTVTTFRTGMVIYYNGIWSSLRLHLMIINASQITVNGLFKLTEQKSQSPALVSLCEGIRWWPIVAFKKGPLTSVSICRDVICSLGQEWTYGAELYYLTTNLCGAF